MVSFEKIVKLLALIVIFAIPMAMDSMILERLTPGSVAFMGATFSLLPLLIVFGVKNAIRAAFFLPLIGLLGYVTADSTGLTGVLNLTFYGGYFVCSLFLEMNGKK